MGEVMTVRVDTSRSPVAWARTGWVGRLLAAAVRTAGPAVLVVSMPRSGSSWVGDMLGQAPDALYLREPVTQGDIAHPRKGTVFDPEAPDVRDSYRRLADRAFLGWPDFAPEIVRDPAQWALRDRPGKRLVIKEVNPRAVAWYLDRYRPRLILLVRHPAAVTLSLVRLGWIPLGPTTWADHGECQGVHLRAAWDALQAYPHHTVVSYEQLCADPLGEFRRLSEFAGLTWTAAVRDQVGHYSTDNAHRIDAWRGAVSPDEAIALRARYRAYDLPWYRDDSEW
jgi:hypothetical protein